MVCLFGEKIEGKIENLGREKELIKGIKRKGECRGQMGEAEKGPIMVCRRADRGLLFGYLGNKMLSLYEDWREHVYIYIDRYIILVII